MRRAGFLVTAVVVMLANGCGVLPDDSAAATWTVAPNQEIDASTSELRLLVSRLGCNSGVTGEVQKPDVRVDDEQVVLTFAVEPDEPSSATCQGNDQVPYDVVLPEPLGDRSLVDGQCVSNGEASDTSFRQPNGVRYSP
jgi:hypothetical protein